MRRERGFTFVELVVVVVVIGVLAAVGMRAYGDFRFTARTTAMDRVGVTIATNMQAAIARYRVNGQGNTIEINGKTIPVFPPGSTASSFFGNPPVPPGAPTGPGMFMLLGCADTPPTVGQQHTCPILPGYTFWVAQDYLQVARDPDGWIQCFVTYQPPSGFAPGWETGTTVDDDWEIWVTYVGWRKYYLKRTIQPYLACR